MRSTSPSRRVPLARSALVVVGVLAGACGPAWWTPAAAVKSCELIAHRGGYWPATTENGMEAIRTSTAQGVERFEIDVRPSRSGVMFAMHDGTVDRTTDGTGRMVDLSTKAIRSLRLDQGGKVPFVGTVVRHAAANDMDLVLHMRRIPARAWKHLRQLVVVNEMRDRTTVMGSRKQIARAERLVPRLDRVLLTLVPVTPDQVAPYDGVAVEHTQVTQQSVDELRTTGRTYWSFTPLTTAHWVALPNVEVTMVKDVAGFRQWCAASQAQ